MKSDTTFQIELETLDDYMSQSKFKEAEILVTRMLDQYNSLDYDLLLKRARIHQCDMKYEQAIQDAKLAHNIQPQRPEAYQALSDFLVAINEHEKAFQLLRILVKKDNSPMLKS